jgi:hypothetical protein
MIRCQVMWPVLNGKLTQRSYRNPTAPVHVVNGASGGKHGNGFGRAWPFTRKRNNAVSSSFTHLTAHNGSHLTVRQYEGDSGELLDQFTIVHDDRMGAAAWSAAQEHAMEL